MLASRSRRVSRRSVVSRSIVREDQTDFGTLVRFLLRGLVVALPLGLLMAAGVYYLSQRIAPTYEASAVILATKSTNTSVSQSTSLSAPPIESSAYSAIALTRPVLLDAISRLGTQKLKPEDLRGTVGVSVEGDAQDLSNLMTVSVQAATPQEAARRANAVAQALVDWDYQRASRNIGQRIDTLEEQIGALDDSIESLRLMGQVASQTEIESRISLRSQQQEELSYARALLDSASGLLAVVEPATPVLVPVAPRPVFNALLATVVTVFLVYGIALLRSAVDTRLRDVEAVAGATNLPVLAEFPDSRNTQLLREAADFLQARLLLAPPASGTRVVLVASPKSGEGKSTLAFNLAESLTRHGHRTLLVDADLRQPTLTQRYQIPSSQDSLLDFMKNPERCVPTWLEVAGSAIEMVPNFQSTPTPLLGRGMAACIEVWKRDYEVIVLDSAPLLPVADTFSLTPLCTHAVMVANIKQSDRRSTKLATDRLIEMGVPLVGVVVMQVKQRLGRRDYNRYLKVAAE